MATFESVMLGLETIRWLANVRANLRGNATAYKAQLVAGMSVAQVGGIMDADAIELLKTIQAVEAHVASSTNRAKVAEALAVFSMTLGGANAVLTELRNAALGLANAAKTTSGEINAAADAVLAAVPNYALPVRT